MIYTYQELLEENERLKKESESHLDFGILLNKVLNAMQSLDARVAALESCFRPHPPSENNEKLRQPRILVKEEIEANIEKAVRSRNPRAGEHMMEIYEGFIYNLRNVRPATILDLHGELYEVVITTGDTQFILLREDEDVAKEEIIAMRRRLLLAEYEEEQAARSSS